MARISVNRLRRRKAQRRSAAWNVLTAVGGVLLFVLCVGYVVAAYALVGILAEISQKDYGPANERLQTYEQFFHNAEAHGLKVRQSPPYIKGGVKYFLWTISVPDRADKLVYRWQHNLQTNRVEPLTNPATHLDLELGYLTAEEARAYPYEPGDTVARKVAKGIFTGLTPEEEPAEEPATETEAEAADETAAEAEPPAEETEATEEEAAGEEGAEAAADGSEGTDEEEDEGAASADETGDEAAPEDEPPEGAGEEAPPPEGGEAVPVR